MSTDYRLSRVTLNKIEHVSSKTLNRFVNILYLSCLFDDMFFDMIQMEHTYVIGE